MAMTARDGLSVSGGTGRAGRAGLDLAPLEICTNYGTYAA